MGKIILSDFSKKQNVEFIKKLSEEKKVTQTSRESTQLPHIDSLLSWLLRNTAQGILIHLMGMNFVRARNRAAF